ncbi:hypothetical protein BJA5080_03401 [Bradyrhizobium diazoefficiens SEMIA 5080]|uniref:Uncharacterized protein n=1 Tax=Bradyrhizobium diazoefficiens SEMIA 5080 TaxID=754504 RepID=A0A837CCB7_9BRAD|nr:hypothetical protein BJA5080_03401 [Bradyrhizobium diazoefficiens SEMIA 5080]
MNGSTMPQFRHARNCNLQHISDVYQIFGLCLRDGKCQANSHQGQFDATTEVAAREGDMEAIAQSGVRHGGNSLYERGHRSESPLNLFAEGSTSTSLPSE